MIHQHSSGSLLVISACLENFLDLTLLEITQAQLPQLESIRKASLQHRSGPPFSAMLKRDKTLGWLLYRCVEAGIMEKCIKNLLGFFKFEIVV
jgi:hypothetical protein